MIDNNKKNKINVFLTNIVLFLVFFFFIIAFYAVAPIFFNSNVNFITAVKSTFFIISIPLLLLIYFIFRTRKDKGIQKKLFFLFILSFFIFSLLSFNNFSFSPKQLKDNIYFLAKYHELMNGYKYNFYKKNKRIINEEEYYLYKKNGFFSIDAQEGACCGFYVTDEIKLKYMND